eukprot:RCo037642
MFSSDENRVPQEKSTTTPSRAQRTTYDWRQQGADPDPHCRKAYGRRPPSIPATSSSLFGVYEPRPEPKMTPELVEKIAQGSTLTPNERGVALYHPQLFRPSPKVNHNLGHAAAVANDGAVVRPWQVGSLPAEFRSGRRLSLQTSTGAAASTDAEVHPSGCRELFADSGRKKRGFFASSSGQDAALPPRPPTAPVGGRKHIEPSVSTSQDFASSPRRRVGRAGEATLDLKMAGTNQKPPLDPSVRFAKKRVDQPYQDSFHIYHPERMAADDLRDTGRKKLTPNFASQNFHATQRKTTPQPSRCPFGTEHSVDPVRSKRAIA